MVVVSPGDGLVELVQKAVSRVVIAAPYIKSGALRRVLSEVSETVSELVCVTRWLPEDIASGACDLEIFDDIERAHGGRLLVHPHLHAKYYSNGQQVLIGSANLTARALGWHTPPNVELLVSISSDYAALDVWEKSLLNSAVRATVQLREQIRLQAEKIKEAGVLYQPPEVENEIEGEIELTLWVPRCPTPERLWQVYCGHGVDTMVTSAFEAAKEDLAALSIPQGLTQALFTAYIVGILKQMPLVAEIDNLASTGLTDTKAKEFLADRLGSKDQNENYDWVWSVVKDWFIYFFPDSYRRETDQEVLVKARELPRR